MNVEQNCTLSDYSASDYPCYSVKYVHQYQWAINYNHSWSSGQDSITSYVLNIGIL